MSEKWRGLHNPEWHRDNGAGYTWCSVCEDRYELGCFSADPCHCCLAAEVAALTARAGKAEAAVERVRETVRRCSSESDSWGLHEVLDALDEVTA